MPGDSLWEIAARHLGDGNQWRDIAALNPQLSDPNRIYAGQDLRLPAHPGVIANVPGEFENIVRVQRGDSLWKLAKAHFGKGQAWSCIADSNPQIGPVGKIFPGQILALPSLCSPLG
jgi:nucleoid-associated protein YgaU